MNSTGAKSNSEKLIYEFLNQTENIVYMLTHNFVGIIFSINKRNS
jgi:hypothetical protein